MSTAHRIIFNTGALYTRVVVTAALALFTSRFVLAALGVVDFGLYSVIVGIMGFMSFLNSAMATSSQRHLTHEIGRGDRIQLNRIFKTSLFLHACLAILLILLGESVGLWFLNHVLNIPELRRPAAFWIYQFTIFSTACFVISVPYQALLTAHEALVAVSILGIIQAMLNFLLAIFISYSPDDRLVTYVLFSSAIAIAMTLVQMALCRSRYPESRICTGNRMSRRLTADLLGFSGWSLFGSLSVVGRFQGVAFLLNIFFGPVVNAAFSIANQMNSMMSQLSQTLLQAISPQMVKQEGAGNRRRMVELSLLTCKYSAFLACFWAIPLFAEIETVLKIWLKTPPEHSAFFCRVALLIFVFDQLSFGFGTVVSAVGNVARYQLLIGGIHLTTIPLAYCFLKLGYNQDSIMLCSLATMIVASTARGWVVSQLIDFAYLAWLKQVLLPVVIGVLPAGLYAFAVLHSVPPSLDRLIFLSITTGFITIIGAYFAGTSPGERTLFKKLAKPWLLRGSQ